MKQIFIITQIILLAVFSNHVAASPINVNIVWSFPASVSVLNYTRTIIQQANQDQNKYFFTLDIKPGAAGSIAARHTLQEARNKKLTILATTDAFFVRPYLYKNPGYSFEDFSMLYQVAQVPLALVAKKGRKSDDIMKNPHVTLSIIGPGSFTHAMAEQIKQTDPDKIILVGYVGTREAVKDVIGGDLDLAFDFVSSVIGDDKVEILGTTGNKNISGHKTLSDLNKNYNNFAQMNMGIFYLYPNQISPKVADEIKTVMIRAQTNNIAFSNALKFDYGFVGDVSGNQQKLYQKRINEMRNFTSGIEKLD
jgi:tripartite-type tricarboxylate transporter receptor subunit TctC